MFSASVSYVQKNALSDFIRERRRVMRWSREDVAERARAAGHMISASYVAMLEKGDPKTGRPSVPTVGKLDALAAGLSVSRNDLLRVVSSIEGEQVGSNHAAAMVSGIRKNHKRPENGAITNRPNVIKGQGQASADPAEGIPTQDDAAMWGELLVPVPVYGPAACGEPLSWTTDDAVDILYLPPRWVEGVDGAIRVRGSSMSGYGINDGDEVLVRKVNGERPPSGKPVVLCVDSTYVVKMFRRDGVDEYLEEYVAGEGHGPRRCHYDRGSLVGIVVRSLKGW